MKKGFFSAIVLFCLAFLMAGCGGSKYGDFIALNEAFVQLMEEYVASLEKAAGPDEIAAAINRLADGMEDLGPKIKKLAEKYPELKDKNNQPEEVKPSQEKAEEVAKKFSGTFMKVMPHMKNPKVQEAFKRATSAMKTMT